MTAISISDCRGASSASRDADQSKEVVLASVVHCHNRTGKLYITLIAPFHRLVVRAMLKRAAARGWR
jgi:hypothetical protein